MMPQGGPWPELGDPDPDSADPAAFDAPEREPGIERGRPKKAATAFRTISEVADDLHVPQHVLRFWETRFPQVKPLKRGGGRRYYRPDDVVLLRRISDLLYVQGYTIKGVQRLLLDGGGVLQDELPPPEQAERGSEHGPDRGPDRGYGPSVPEDPSELTSPTPQPPQPPQALRSTGAPSRQLLAEILSELEALRRMLPDIR